MDLKIYFTVESETPDFIFKLKIKIERFSSIIIIIFLKTYAEPAKL